MPEDSGIAPAEWQERLTESKKQEFAVRVRISGALSNKPIRSNGR